MKMLQQIEVKSPLKRSAALELSGLCCWFCNVVLSYDLETPNFMTRTAVRNNEICVFETIHSVF
jgi:hypothetical protein